MTGQPYRFGLFAAYCLPFGLAELVRLWVHPHPPPSMQFELVSVLMMIATGLTAASVRPWGWYAIFVVCALGVAYSAVYLTMTDTITAVAKPLYFIAAFALNALTAAYFYKRRAMFGATWRWGWLEAQVPRVVGPERYDGPPRAVHRLSRRAKLLYASVLVLAPVLSLV